jgi:hypothetical protein
MATLWNLSPPTSSHLHTDVYNTVIPHFFLLSTCAFSNTLLYQDPTSLMVFSFFFLGVDGGLTPFVVFVPRLFLEVRYLPDCVLNLLFFFFFFVFFDFSFG